MNVLLIHEHGRSFGSGAVIAMHRLHRWLGESGVASIIACRKRAIDSPDVIELPRADVIEDWLGRVTWRLGLNDVHCVSSFAIPKMPAFQQADVVNIHGLHSNFFNYLALPRLARRKPVVLTLHDMWNLTGHCAQSGSCDRWQTGCGRCPSLGAHPPVGRDATAVEWRLKQWTYRRAPMTVVCPSRWLTNLTRQSMLRGAEIHHIPNAVDTSLFAPMSMAAARSALGLPHDARVLMFASAALNDRMKGGPVLLEALQTLPLAARQGLVLLLLGDRGESMQRASGINCVGLGYVKDDASKVLAYNAADVFVLPSLAENHSLVLVEAAACGRPAVAFNVGGNGEIVRDGRSGLLARAVTAAALRDALATVLASADLRRRMGAEARAHACAEFDRITHVQRYLGLFTHLRARGVVPHAHSAAAAPAAHAIDAPGEAALR